MEFSLPTHSLHQCHAELPYGPLIQETAFYIYIYYANCNCTLFSSQPTFMLAMISSLDVLNIEDLDNLWYYLWWESKVFFSSSCSTFKLNCEIMKHAETDWKSEGSIIFACSLIQTWKSGNSTCTRDSDNCFYHAHINKSSPFCTIT